MVILLKNATLIDGTGGPPLSRAVIGLEGQRIKLVGTEAELGSRQADFETVLDLQGKTVIPGLINCHEHLQFKRTLGSYEARTGLGPLALLARCVRSASLCLQEGVTTVRDVGAIDHVNISVKQAIATGMVVGPRVFSCGWSIGMTGCHGYRNSVEADGPGEVLKAARRELKAGADLVKLKASGGNVNPNQPATGIQLTIEEMRPAFEEAHRAGKPTTVHAHGDAAVRNSVEAGVDCIEHGSGLSPETLGLLAKRGVWLVPTASQFKLIAEQGETFQRQQWLVTRSREQLEERMKWLESVVASGVKLAAGTDSMGLVKAEVKMFAAAGMSRMEALRTATAMAAELLGKADELGTVEAGKCADLVILEGDPLADLSALSRISLTVKGGALYYPPALAASTGRLQPTTPPELDD